MYARTIVIKAFPDQQMNGQWPAKSYKGLLNHSFPKVYYIFGFKSTIMFFFFFKQIDITQSLGTSEHG